MAVNPDFEIVLCNPQDRRRKFVLPFSVFEIPIAKRWFTQLERVVYAKRPVAETGRFYGFPQDNRNTKEWVVGEINRCIDVIHQEYPTLIPLRASISMRQEDFNQLHIYFEKFRGPVLSPAFYFKRGTRATKRAFQDYNVAIHRYEFNSRLKEHHDRGWATPREFIVTFKGRSRIPLEPEDYEHFTLAFTSGFVFINYCEVGKHLWEMCCDEDEVVGDDNIRPLRYYSADIKIWLGQSDAPEVHQKKMHDFLNWFERNQNKLDKLGFKKDDPRNAVGDIPVAQLQKEFVDEHPVPQLIEEMKDFLEIDSVRLPGWNYGSCVGNVGKFLCIGLNHWIVKKVQQIQTGGTNLIKSI